MLESTRNKDINSKLESTQQIHLSDYLNIIRRRKWIIITFLLVVVCIVAYKTYTTIPAYKATATILIEGQSFTINEMKGINNAYLRQGDETKLELLKSRSLASKVVEDLRLREYLAKRTPQKPNLLSLPLKMAKKYIRNFLSKPTSDTKEALPASLGESSESEHASKPKIQDKAVYWYLSKLEVVSIPDTKLINITFEDSSSEMVARIANKHSRLFIERSTQVQNQESKHALKWLKVRINEQKQKMELAKLSVNKYKYEQLGSLSVNDATVFSFPEIKQNHVIQKSSSKLTELKTEKLELSSKFGPKHPKIVAIKSSISKYKQVIIDQMQKIRASIKTELDRSVFVENSIPQPQGKHQQVGKIHTEDSINYYMLKLEEESEKEIYDLLLRQAKEIDLTGNMENENFSIVDVAEMPRYPFKPNVFNNFLMSVVIGLALGIGFGFFFEYMDRTIKTPEGIMKHLEMSVIGVLPYEKSLKENKQLAFPVKEDNNIQMKRTNNYYSYKISNSLVSSLPLMPSRTSGQIFMVESSTSGEGKTTVLAKSAVSLARGGLRVIMVDGDMFRPSLHNLFGLENNGLLNSMSKIMSLKVRKGKLDKYSMDDLFFLIALRRQSGRLIVTDNSQSQMTVFFENGRLFYIQSQDTPFDNRLGTMLLRGDFITESQLKEALDRNKRTGQPLGYILVNAGYITQTKLQGPLKLQMEEHLQKIFSWKQGDFAFEPDTVETYEDKRIYFQEDYSQIIDRLSRIVGSYLLEREMFSYVKPVNEPNLSLLPAGIGDVDSQGPLYYTLLTKYIDFLKQHFDVILIDAPPVLDTMGGVKPLITLADGIIFVVKSGHVSIEEVKDALQFMKEGKDKIIGTVLNQVKGGGMDYNY